MRVVCDTTPLHYLLLIDEVNLLPALFGHVSIPAQVQREMLHAKAPSIVRRWAASPPAWVSVESDQTLSVREMAALDAGEAQAIATCKRLHVDFLLTDDLAARREAKSRGILVLTTLLVLDTAARKGLIDLRAAIAKLLQTNFRVDAAVITHLLATHPRDGGGR